MVIMHVIVRILSHYLMFLVTPTTPNSSLKLEMGGEGGKERECVCVKLGGSWWFVKGKLKIEKVNEDISNREIEIPDK